MVGTSENDRLVWIDCEMTGLDPEVDELVEIAVIVTDFELRPLDPGFQIVIKPDASALANMSEFVTNMHRTSGLLDEIPHGVTTADAEFQVLEYHAPAKNGGHRALADISESIRELAYYRQAVFVPQPGPTSDTARAAAEAAVSSYASEV